MSEPAAAARRLLDAGPVRWDGEGEPHVEWATVDAIRSFARGTGDDNPLYTDLATAETSPWHGMIAPPLFVLATGSPPDPDPADGDPADDDRADDDRGVGANPSSDDISRFLRTQVHIGRETWRFLHPVRVGDRLTRLDVLQDPVDTTTGFTVTQRTRWSRDQHLVAVRDRDRHYDPSARGATTRVGPPATYTPDQIAQFEAANLAETRRGADTRGSTSVTVGDTLGPIIRGPLTITDLITYRAVVGQGPLRSGVLRLRSVNRRTHPALFTRNRSGAWDTLERMHWDAGHATEVGHPSAYDYSHTRSVWMTQLLTDWAGDGAWLQALTVEATGHCYVGDTTWLRGQVRSVEAPGPAGGRVEIELVAHDQTGDRTGSALATVALPAQDGGAVTLPPPAPDRLPRPIPPDSIPPDATPGDVA